MSRYYYDLHIHSCLSPCADNDMTPNNIAGMAVVNGLNLVALTDHNTTKNCRPFFTAAKKHGIVPVAGMEMTTAEDIHIVALFPTLESAEAFDTEFQQYRILYLNKTHIFGDQLLMDENDEIIGQEPHLLLNACSLSVQEAVPLLRSYGAAVFPAHVDRPENGMIAALGCIPDDPHFNCVEFREADAVDAYIDKYGLRDKIVLQDSDAHYLWDIHEKGNFLELEDVPYSSSRVREALIRLINQA